MVSIYMEINWGGRRQKDKHYCLENDHFLIFVIWYASCPRGTAYKAATKATRWESCAAAHTPAVETQGSDSTLFPECPLNSMH